MAASTRSQAEQTPASVRTGVLGALRDLHQQRASLIAAVALGLIALHLALRWIFGAPPGLARLPLLATLLFGGVPFVISLTGKFVRGEFGSDLLGGISIVTSVLLSEYLAGSIIVLMLAGGEALERYAVRSASSVLASLAKRLPSIAHVRREGSMTDVPLDQVRVGDLVEIFPHETAPVDGLVVAGRGVMDESYLTGEPFQMTKIAGANVISGAINGDTALTIQATARAADSRYARIMAVMHESERHRPRLRRLGDQLGAVYTPVALAIAVIAWIATGNPLRFLSVLVIATPCPLLIGIPVSIIGSISLCARRAIIVKSPAALETVNTCRTALFDKTGTLTYGEPTLAEVLVAPGLDRTEVVSLVASLERYSKHPLGRAILAAADAERLTLPEAQSVSERPGEGLRGTVSGRAVLVTSRGQIQRAAIAGADAMPTVSAGLECAVAIDGRYAGLLRFRDRPRDESRSLIAHLRPRHHFDRLMILSGDRASEVEYLAERVGITEVRAEQTPEQKLAIVRDETSRARTLYVGDGVNDAPAMMAATVGVAIGQNSDVTSEAAAIVVMDSSLVRLDEFLHIGRRMRRIALESAVGGMLLSIGGMGFAAFGYLGPVQGAMLQEVIDVLAVLNALRAAVPPKVIHDL
jgi:heavy metal translocating P-type ATPase